MALIRDAGRKFSMISPWARVGLGRYKRAAGSSGLFRDGIEGQLGVIARRSILGCCAAPIKSGGMFDQVELQPDLCKLRVPARQGVQTESFWAALP